MRDEPGERQLVQEEQAGKIHHPVPGVGGQEQQAGIALGLNQIGRASCRERV